MTPIYDYECKQGCGRFEQIKRWQEADDVKCPACKGEVKRVFSPFAFSFGWRLTPESNYIKGWKDEFEKDI